MYLYGSEHALMDYHLNEEKAKAAAVAAIAELPKIGTKEFNNLCSKHFGGKPITNETNTTQTEQP